jgi:hypothetical protein
MRFPYTLSVARSIDTGKQIVLLRPEIPIRVYGPAGAAELLALVDTGADNSVFPLSIAHDLGIQTTPGRGPSATAFGGQQIALSFADVVLELSQDDAEFRWLGRLYFADFPDGTEKAVILGHEGFLDYFTATFDGEGVSSYWNRTKVCRMSKSPADDRLVVECCRPLISMAARQRFRAERTRRTSPTTSTGGRKTPNHGDRATSKIDRACPTESNAPRESSQVWRTRVL